MRVSVKTLLGMLALAALSIVLTTTAARGLSAPEEAANMIAEACVYKPVRIATRLGITGQVLHAFAPKVAQIVMNTTFRMFPDSEAAKGEKGDKPKLSAEAVALQQMMRGIHF